MINTIKCKRTTYLNTNLALRTEAVSLSPLRRKRLRSHHLRRIITQQEQQSLCCDAGITIRNIVSSLDTGTLELRNDMHTLSAWKKEAKLYQQSSMKR